MRRTLTLGPIAAAFLFAAVVCAQDGAAPSPSRSRVRISGTGSNIVLERDPRPERKSAPAPVPEAPASPVDAATELKAAGASDEAVLSHLRAHAGEIPPVILAEDVRRLRKSGAGPDVIAWLSRNTALDIGETGEGHESPDYSAAPPPQDYGMGVYEAGYAVPGAATRLRTPTRPAAAASAHASGATGGRRSRFTMAARRVRLPTATARSLPAAVDIGCFHELSRPLSSRADGVARNGGCKIFTASKLVRLRGC